MECLGGPSASLSDLLSTIPLVLEVSRLRVPVVDYIWDCVEGHDSFHKWGGDSGSEETDQDVVVCDASTSGVALEHRDVALERGRELSVFLIMWWVDSQEMAFPAMSWCLKVCWNFLRKSSQVPRETAVPLMAFSQKVLAQVWADPLVIYERAKPNFFASLL